MALPVFPSRRAGARSSFFGATLCAALALGSVSGLAGCDDGLVLGSPSDEFDDEAERSSRSESFSDLETNELVRRVAALPRNSVVVFDFDDTLLDHDVEDWSPYARRAVRYLHDHGINIAICSANENRNGALERRLPDLNSDVFDRDFFESPAFQVNTRNRGDRSKFDEIQTIMEFYDVELDEHVVFFDDKDYNIESVTEELDLNAVLVGQRGLIRSDFRTGMEQLLVAGSSESCGADVKPGDFCRLCGPCGEGEGDCDSDSECLDGLVCVGADGRDKDEPGHDVCAPPASPPVPDTCPDDVSPGDLCRLCGPCGEGEGDCDSDSECQPGLVCVGADGGDKDEPGHDICASPTDAPPSNDEPSEPDAPTGDIRVVGTTVDKDQSGTLAIDVPSATRSGDLLLLFLYRTDGPNIWTASDLAGRVSGPADWRGPLASCAIDNSRGDFDCGGREADLNQVLFHKRAESGDLGGRLRIDMPGDKPGWAILVAVRGASTSNPLRASAGQTRCDRDPDTVFPSVPGGQRGDLLLLSQAFDDGGNTGVSSDDFRAPDGTVRHGVVIDRDEAGHVYGRVLTRDGATPEFQTIGAGDDNCKDAPMSLLIRPL